MSDERLHALYVAFSRSERNPEADRTALRELAGWARERQSNANGPEDWIAAIDNCANEIAERATLLAMALAEWLAGEEDHALAKVVLRHANSRYFKAATPVSFDLAAMGPEIAATVCRRLCSRFASPAITLGWALSLARDFPDHPAAGRCADAVLTFLANELPNTARNLLSAEASAFGELPKAVATLARIQANETRMAAFESLPELKMTREMRWIRARLNREEQREIMEGAKERSVFAQIVTERHFKYATQVVLEHLTPDGMQESTLSMASFSAGIELPLSEVIDPIMGRLRRAALWSKAP